MLFCHLKRFRLNVALANVHNQKFRMTHMTTISLQDIRGSIGKLFFYGDVVHTCMGWECSGILTEKKKKK